MREALAPGAQRAVGLAQLLGQARDVADERALAGRHGLGRGQLLQHRQPLGGPAGPGQELVEPPRHGEHVAARDARLAQRGAQKLGGPDLVVEVDAHAGRVGQERDLARRIRAALGRRGRRRRVVVHAIGGLGQLAKRALGGRRRRVEAQELGVVLDGGIVLAQLGQALGRVAVQRDLALDVSQRQGRLDHADQIAGAAGRLVVVAQEVERALAHRRACLGRGGEPLEQHAGALVGRLAARLGHEQAQGVQRARRLAKVVVPGRRDAQAQLRPLARRHVIHALLPELDQLGEALVLLEQPLERERLLGIAGEQVQAAQVRDRLGRSRGQVLGDLVRLLEERLLARAVAGLAQRAVVEVEQIAPALGDGEGDGQPLERPLRARRQLEHAQQHLRQTGGVLPEPLLVEADRALANQLGALVVEVGAQHAW